MKPRDIYSCSSVSVGEGKGKLPARAWLLTWVSFRPVSFRKNLRWIAYKAAKTFTKRMASHTAIHTFRVPSVQVSQMNSHNEEDRMRFQRRQLLSDALGSSFNLPQNELAMAAQNPHGQRVLSVCEGSC